MGGKDHQEDQQGSEWLDDVKERIGLSSNEEPDDRVPWRKYVSCVTNRIEYSMEFNFTQLSQIE